jgi:hypothetical protein
MSSNCSAASKRAVARVRKGAVIPYARMPTAAMAVSCGHTEPLW